MKCDIILEVGNGNVINITRDSSQVELESLDDIIKFLNENKRGELRQIINDLQSSRKTISITDKSNFLKFGIFPNASFDDLKSLYPDVFSDIDSIDQPYHYLLRDRLTYNGEKLYGRIVIKPSAKKGETPVEGLKDTVLYIFRNENDVKAFAKTERTRKKAEAILTDNNEIKDDHLKKVYESKINAIAKHFGFDKTKDFINNYLNNKSLYKVPKDLEYKGILEINGEQIHINQTIDNFFRELNDLIVMENDTPLAHEFRKNSRDWKLEEIKKGKIYEILSENFEEFKKKYESKDNFFKLSQEELSEELKLYFDNDFVLREYEIKSVTAIKEGYKPIPSERLKTLIKNIIKEKNEQLKNSTQLDAEKFDINSLSEEQVQEFFKGHTIKIGGKERDIYVAKDNNGNRTIAYRDITDEGTIYLSRNRQTVETQFGLGWDSIIKTVEEPTPYNGYYIYKIPENEDTYVITSSPISPNLYDAPRFNSIEKCKNQIDAFNRYKNVNDAALVNLKREVATRTITLSYPLGVGLVLSCINYKIEEKVTLPSADSALIENRYDHIIGFYNERYGINISSFTTPEQVGTFMYAMVQNDLSISKLELELKDNENLSLDTMSKINTIILDINNAGKKFFVVDKMYKSANKEYKAYIRHYKEENINYSGKDIKKPVKSLTDSLWNLKDSFESRFKGLKIEIVDDELLKELKEAGSDKLLFDKDEDTSKIKSFVYNNTIYINQTTAKDSDLIHEALHIMFGIIRGRNFEAYTKLLEGLYSKYNSKNRLSYLDSVVDLETYKNLSYYDKLEEKLVRHLGNKVLSSKVFGEAFRTNSQEEIDKFTDKLITELNDNLTLPKSTFSRFLNSFNSGLNKSEQLDSKVTFSTIIDSLWNNDNLNSTQIQRKITNAISEGIKNKSIIENCE